MIDILDREQETYGTVGFYLDVATMAIFGGRHEYGPPPEIFVGWTAHQDNAYENQAAGVCGAQIHEFGLFAIAVGNTRPPNMTLERVNQIVGEFYQSDRTRRQTDQDATELTTTELTTLYTPQNSPVPRPSRAWTQPTAVVMR